MSNFNTSREIDMRAYLPDILKEIKEFLAIEDAEQPTIAALWRALETCMDDQFVPTATEQGIARREKMLGVLVQPGDTLEDRRFRVLSKYTESIPYTRKGLERMLTSLCGEKGFVVVYPAEAYTMVVKVRLTAKKQRAAVADLLERVSPYNMVISVELIYNQWKLLKERTWGELKRLTWGQIKEEVLPNA